MHITGIIPARYSSTRFPGKPLAMIHGQSMIQRVYMQCTLSALTDILVATDDERIHEHVLGFGGKSIMTSEAHHSGTDRCLEAIDRSAIVTAAVINVQGDEPFIQPGQINRIIELLTRPEVRIATLAIAIEDPMWLQDRNKVKVICDRHDKAIYFSRTPIPFQKDHAPETWTHHFRYLKHVGIYGFQLETLRELCALDPSPLEKAESLEQLRWIENGYSIHLSETDQESPSVDTPEDLERILALYNKK